MAGMRTFATGATRDLDAAKYDYEGFLSPLVLERYGAYMHQHRHLPDGTLRDSDNWQLGIEKKAYISSMWRHLIELWKGHRGYDVKETLEESLCALIFNASGYLHELLKEKNVSKEVWKMPPHLTDCKFMVTNDKGYLCDSGYYHYGSPSSPLQSIPADGNSNACTNKEFPGWGVSHGGLVGGWGIKQSDTL